MPSQTSNSGKYLTTDGVSVAWGTVTPGTGTVTSVGLTSNLSGITVSGSPVTSSGSISLSGTLNVANGGTGVASLSTGAVLVGNGTSAVSSVAPSSSGNVLTSNGSSWSSSALPTASASVSGVVSTGTQTFAGDKTLSGTTTIGTGIVSSNGYNFTSTGNSIYWTGAVMEVNIGSAMKFYVGSSQAGFSISDVTKVGGGSFNSYSDSRYKQDISAYNKGLAELKQVEPKNYRFTAEFMKSDAPSQQFVGVIAQELEGTAFANCVKTDDNGFKSVDTSELTFALINAVKEMSQRIEQLEARNG